MYFSYALRPEGSLSLDLSGRTLCFIHHRIYKFLKKALIFLCLGWYDPLFG